jgi:hypothetical protein
MTLFAALSSTPLIHAAKVFPACPAAAVYRARRSLERRSSYRSASGFSTGGRPLGRLAGILNGQLDQFFAVHDTSLCADIMPVQIIVDKVLG